MRMLILVITSAIPGIALAATTGGATIPEPTTMALLASGAAAVGLYRKVKGNKKK